MLSSEREHFVKDGVLMQTWQFEPAWGGKEEQFMRSCV